MSAENHRIHIRRRTVTAKAEIAEAVSNVFPFIVLYRLQNMRMMTDDQICPTVNRRMRQRFLCLIRLRRFFRAPVECDNHQLRALLLCNCNRLLYLFFPRHSVIQDVYSNKGSRYTIYLFYCDFISDAVIDSGRIQRLLCIGQALCPIIAAVIVRQGDDIYGSVCQNLRVGRIAFKCIFLCFPCCLSRQRPFKICKGRIIRLKDRPDILEKV